ncbi:MAG TPA: ATP-binding protein [Thermomicrobiales bacterium]|jgi:hypothetical protein|nr:ATP-binding protein [Thermomicrobiales bacterium]
MSDLPSLQDALDRLARLASRLIGVPIAMVTVIEPDRQRFLGQIGLPEPWASDRESPLSMSLCQYPAASGEILTIRDTRLASHIPTAANVIDAGIIAYAGVPLRSREGEILGTFCAIDREPRDWTPEEISALEDLAASASAELGLQLANTRLARARSFADAIVNTLRRPLIVLDNQLTIVACNAAFPRTFRLDGAPVIGQSIATVGDGRWDDPVLLGELRATLHDQVRRDGIELHRDMPGLGARTIRVNITPLEWSDADEPMLLVSLEDATTSIRIQRERQEFIDTMAHDLRNPVAAIRGEAQLLARRAARGTLDESRMMRSLGVIDDGTARMVRLIDDMVDTVYLSAGQPITLDVTEVDLSALIDDVVRNAGMVTSAHHFEVEVRVPVTVQGDTVRLRRVLDNLISNAIKYSPNGGTIAVTLDDATVDGRAGGTIMIADEGIGIPPQDLPRLFDRFHRGANVGVIEGSGIGLSGVRQLVEQHGGRVSVESTVEIGTTVSVWLPAGDLRTATPADAPSVSDQAN